MPADMIMERDRSTNPIPAETLTESGFFWRESNGIRVLTCGPLRSARFENAFSTRVGGVSAFPKDDLNLAGFDDDTKENIAENRRRFLELFDDQYELATVWQVHGDGVKLVDSLGSARASNDKCDAIISDSHGVLAGVKTADCVPILIGDPRTGAFAAVHAGWRGTASSITSKAVYELKRKFATDPADMIAAIGPAATADSYEVGQDVINAFRENFEDADRYFRPTRAGHAFADIKGANRDQLVAAGVRPESVFIAPHCTIERTDIFFSYRAEAAKLGKCGRLLSVIGRR